MKRDSFEAALLVAGRLAAGRLAAGRLAAGRLAAGRLAAGRLAAGLLAAGLLAACQNLAAQTEQAAIIANPTTASRDELRDVLADALGGRAITLSPDALTQASTLWLEGAVRGDLQRVDPRGRDLGRPIRFDLLMDGEACFLVRQSTQQRWQLTDTDCTPAAAASDPGND